MTKKSLQQITDLVKNTSAYGYSEIEASVIEYICSEKKLNFWYHDEFKALEDAANDEILKIFKEKRFGTDIEFVIEFFEAMLDREKINENGIVFTPRYIADYMSNRLAGCDKLTSQIKVIDPGCGCGIFLISFADTIKKKTNLSYKEIFEECIYGIDIDSDNVRRCKLVINLYILMCGESNKGLQCNIFCKDSLKSNWNEQMKVDGFDYIIGNPPYVNTHDMSKETATFLKQNFLTTKTGVYNIFYAFIEHAVLFLKDTGSLCYIVPNNFLTIKSATDLRKFLTENRYLVSIIDFADNMVFKPVRTYNCIIEISQKPNEIIDYCVMNKVKDVESELKNLVFEQKEIKTLDKNGWKLVDRQTMNNIHKIEGQFRSIKDFIRTGIATLRDNVFMVNYDGNVYYKNVGKQRYEIEAGLVKRLYKIPDLKNCQDICSACRYIIFPYRKTRAGFELIPEDIFKEEYPQTYAYLLTQKHELDARDNGKPNATAWYAYGRTQGLNKYGRKLVFPTFAYEPRFTMLEDDCALFCNGYAVFENDYIDLEILRMILNSVVMQYYVSNTSYAIEGGYYCYQKKYIEKFSLPYFDSRELDMLKNMGKEELDAYLIDKYELVMQTKNIVL